VARRHTRSGVERLCSNQTGAADVRPKRKVGGRCERLHRDVRCDIRRVGERVIASGSASVPSAVPVARQYDGGGTGRLVSTQGRCHRMPPGRGSKPCSGGILPLLSSVGKRPRPPSNQLVRPRLRAPPIPLLISFHSFHSRQICDTSGVTIARAMAYPLHRRRTQTDDRGAA